MEIDRTWHIMKINDDAVCKTNSFKELVVQEKKW